MRALTATPGWARAGPLWGAYPQRRVDDEAIAARSRRRRGLRAARIAAAVGERLAAGAPDPSRVAIAARLMRDRLDEPALVDALAMVSRAMAAHVGWRPGPTQWRCAALLLDGRLAEMDTGEGKTCAAALAATVAGLAGASVHVMTANEYLAERDQRMLAPLFDALGLRSACVREADADDARRDAYRARIVYATARCVAFDYLRDQQHAGPAGTGRAPIDAVIGRAPPTLLGGLCVAIVDEADSILIDEAAMPLVLSERVDDPPLRGRVWRALTLARRLAPEHDFTTPATAGRSATGSRPWALTDGGRERIAEWAAGFGDAWRHPSYRVELIEQALLALHGLRRDADYLVQDGQIVIVDAHSGRPAAQRRWSRDLHALVALKEQLALPDATETRARTTYPALFARYHHLCGLSGTLREGRRELARQYGLGVRRVPRAQPLRRARLPMRLFADRPAQAVAAIARAGRLAARGRAVLLVTDTVEDTRTLASACRHAGLAVTELSARDEAVEADVIARAGQAGRVTIATQMAGRGTDIALADDVRAAGGLHIINLQHNRSARVDRQVAGRAGRRGDPGSVEHWLRLGDSPLAPERLPGALGALARLARRTIGFAAAESLAGALLLSAWQRRCEREDRHRRARLGAHDRAWSKALSFTRIKV